MKIRFILTIGTILSIAVFANQPSFNCVKIKQNTPEALICSSNQLMDLDRELSDIYKKALLKASEEDMLKAEQKGWIKSRNECWKAEDEKKCMVNAYRGRMQELKEKYTLSLAEQSNTDNGAKGFDKVLKFQGITFHVQATNKGSLNQLTITPSGLEKVNDVIKQEIDGSVTDVEVADLNKDGSPEVYVYVTSAGSGSYGSLVAYSANHNKSLSEIYLPLLENDKKVSQGYMGHDEFSIVDNRLTRHFPVYKKGDANCCPKGGIRQLQYKLVPGEATWQLKLIKP